MEIENIVREFLHVIDFELCGLDSNCITIQDLRNPNSLNEVLQLPIDFKSSDDLRVFKGSKLTNDYYISVLNTKYPSVPFSKNGIDGIDLSLRKKESEESFMSQLFLDDDLYITAMGWDSNSSYISYMTVESNRPSMMYQIKKGNRILDFSNFLSNRKVDRKLCLCESIEQESYGAVLTVKENNEEVYRREISKEEVDSYFQALAYHTKSLVEKANSGIQRLSTNLYEMLFNHYNAARAYMQLVHQSTGSNIIVDALFEEYFPVTPNEEKGHMKKL